MKSNEIRDQIREAQINRVTALNLSSKKLTSLPPEISKLKNLTELDISNNELTSLPHEIGELKNLTSFNVSDNRLTLLPPEISELKNLTSLNISVNELTSLPHEISGLKSLTKLNVFDNRLASLPPEILELKDLTEFDIYGNQLTSLPPEISELKNLTRLNLANNQLTSLPSEVLELKDLTELDVSKNQLTSLPPEISELKNLIKFNMCENRLISLPPGISELKSLTELNIHENRLTFLPPEISELKNLTELDIYGNQLTSLPPEILGLKSLTKLNVFNNQLTSLPPEISELKNLTELDVSKNQLTSLPPEISELKSLTKLNIYENRLTFLPPEISELKSLTELNIYQNRLTSLPPEISELKSLTVLDISENQLTSLPPEISELKNLIKLDISSNQLTSLPIEILELDLKIEWEEKCEFSEFRSIYLHNNPFENPPTEIVKNGREAVLHYFKSLKSEKKRLNEVKVLLVGDGGAGKTSLVKRLFREEVDGNEPQTHGINISRWVAENGGREIKANFWDFGGQEIMHATHQFFLSKRSLYILVLDGRKDEKPEYWLKLIENFSGDSPILVVINKIDENPAFELNRKFLKAKYPSIRGFYRLSCKSNKGIEEFSKILKEELAKVKLLEIKWPKSWFNVKSRLEGLRLNCSLIEYYHNSEHCNFITYWEYKKMCEEEGIKNESEQDTLVDFLHDLGVILHFRDIPLLNTHVLEPEWVTNAVYKIINSRVIADSRGVMKLDMLPEILRQNTKSDFYYPPDQYNFIINLMKKFELSYELDDSTMLLPSLLEIQEPNFNFDYDGTLKFIIDYDFLPPSVMPRFIIKMNRNVKDDLRWRTGVVIEDKYFDSCAVIRADNEAKRINIYVKGEQRRDYFVFILQNFREINNSFEKLKATEKIPLPDNPEVTVSYKHLIKLEIKGIDMYMPDGSDYEYRVCDLLGTIINRSSERALMEDMWQITEMSKSNEKEILEIFRNLQENATESDTEESLLNKINTNFPTSPYFNRIGINFGEIVRLYLKQRKRRS
jgi:internalin A